MHNFKRPVLINCDRLGGDASILVATKAQTADELKSELAGMSEFRGIDVSQLALKLRGKDFIEIPFFTSRAGYDGTEASRREIIERNTDENGDVNKFSNDWVALSLTQSNKAFVSGIMLKIGKTKFECADVIQQNGLESLFYAKFKIEPISASYADLCAFIVDVSNGVYEEKKEKSIGDYIEENVKLKEENAALKRELSTFGRNYQPKVNLNPSNPYFEKTSSGISAADLY